MADLFSEFKPVSPEEWKKQILHDLKAGDYEALLWRNENGFDIEPFYASSGEAPTYLPAFSQTGWEICVKSRYKSDLEINAHLLQALEQGASAIWMESPAGSWQAALENVRLDMIATSFSVKGGDMQLLIDFLSSRPDLEPSRVTIFHQPSNADELNTNLQRSRMLRKKIRACTADVLPFHNQGSYAAYETAIALSALAEYTEGSEKIAGDGNFVLRMGVTSDYFVQLAKFRAMRRLWLLFQREREVQNGLEIIAETSLTNKTLSGAYNNLLRTTVEIMAAAGGGCEQIIANEFDIFSGRHSRLSERLAINQQHMLMEESFFGKTGDSACGSYFIEKLTDLVAAKALEIFKGFEKEGGYFECLRKNIFSSEIERQAKSRIKKIKDQEEIVIGLNKYTDPPGRTDEQGNPALIAGNGGIALAYELEYIHGKSKA
jgi:methylmalonyl-CoA mutase